MDIKNVLKSVLPIGVNPKAKVEKAIKTDSTTDRDANGQTGYGQQQREKEKPPMTDEQLKKAMDHLKNLAVVKDHNLSVVLTELEGKKFVLIKEPSGKVVRRIAEAELWTLQVVKDTEKGQLLRKTA
ncbi:MAG: hypothetical protein BroJett040_05280 [Oligoflexia bacterium]|nr:MAG: hypothetical protein BroJett040_05280 [Oligoflexia bacterium]